MEFISYPRFEQKYMEIYLKIKHVILLKREDSINF